MHINRGVHLRGGYSFGGFSGGLVSRGGYLRHSWYTTYDTLQTVIICFLSAWSMLNTFLWTIIVCWQWDIYWRRAIWTSLTDMLILRELTFAKTPSVSSVYTTRLGIGLILPACGMTLTVLCYWRLTGAIRVSITVLVALSVLQFRLTYETNKIHTDVGHTDVTCHTSDDSVSKCQRLIGAWA